jgi:hypothetical protein
VLYKLEDRVRPYVHKVLVVIEPLLIDEDYYARVEGREIIANLAKAAGLAQMIAAMRPDIDNVDEWVFLGGRWDCFSWGGEGAARRWAFWGGGGPAAFPPVLGGVVGEEVAHWR